MFLQSSLPLQLGAQVHSKRACDIGDGLGGRKSYVFKSTLLNLKLDSYTN